MFSRRTAWPTAHNALTQALAARRALGQPVLDLTVANPSAVGLDWPDREGLRAALGDPRVLSYDPEPFGRLDARAALSSWLGGQGLDLAPSQICLTASTSEAYAFLFKLLCDPGDAVLVPWPSYPLFDDLAGLEGVRLIRYPLRYDGEWHLDAAALEDALTHGGGRARALVTLHPNNPTGHYQKPEELERLRGCCARHDLALISDEVFYEHPTGEGRPPAARAASSGAVLTFSLGGLSKLAGLPQLKLGWILASGPPAKLDAALARLDVLADTYLSVGTPAQLALPSLLQGVEGQLRRFSERRRLALSVLEGALRAEPALDRLRCEGGWTAILRLPAIRSSEQWALAVLEQAGVLVQPGYFYGLDRPDAHLVVSLLTEGPRLSAGAAALVSAVSGALIVG